MKKLLSLLLTLAIVAAAVIILPVSAAAEETDDANVPRIYVTTADGNGTTLQKEDGYVDATITVVDTDGTELSDSILIKVRGNSTALESVTKKAFTFKFAKKKDVLGMGAAKKWALLANTFDPTLMRNYIAFDLAHTMDLPYTSEQCYVELWLDDSYRGCYSLMEPIQEGKTRVNIDIESNNGMKDFMIEREHSRSESDTTYFYTDGTRYAIKEPESPNADQTAYIKSTMDSIMNTVKTGTREEIEAAIDVPSFTRFYLLNELYKTVDFDFSSVFFHYKDGKLYAGPSWDYDLAAGNIDPTFSAVARDSSETEGLFAATRHFYKYLCSYDWFNEEIRETYLEYYDHIANYTAPGGFIDTLLSDYGTLYNKNYTDAGWKVSRWWVTLQRRPDSTFDANIAQFRTWLSDRNAWLSDYYNLFANSYLLGDADGDGDISVLDATRVQRVLAGFTFDDVESISLRGDVSEDELDIVDATLIQRWLAGFEVYCPIGSRIRLDQ